VLPERIPSMPMGAKKQAELGQNRFWGNSMCRQLDSAGLQLESNPHQV